MADLDQALATRPSPTRLNTWWVLIILLAAAVFSRAAAFGDPVAHIDDQFYLLAGQILNRGGWMYVDVWDRKPVGLFLLYAGIARLGGTYAVEAVQIAAGLSAAATAWIIVTIARCFAPERGAVLAGIFYLFCLPAFGGQTGQTPVFYNLLIAGAAALLFSAVDQPAPGGVARRALAAMDLCGLAMTIKQISFIEGGFIGLAFLWRFRASGGGWSETVALGAAMIAIALLPTLAALGVYVAAGHGEAFVFANFQSIFLKGEVGGQPLAHGLKRLMIFMPLIGGCAGVGAWLRRAERGPAEWLLLGWIAASTVGYLFLPYFFDHYALPMMVPLSISAASLFALRRGWLAVVALGVLSAAQGGMLSFGKHQERRQTFAAIVQATKRELRGGCVYIAGGPPQIYLAVPACRTSRFVFPEHLTFGAEAKAIGVDQLVELQRVLDTRPAVIITNEEVAAYIRPEVQRMLADELRANYRWVSGLKATGTPRNLVSLRLWSRRDQPARRSPSLPRNSI